MRHIDDLRITIKSAAPLQDHSRPHLSMVGDNTGELWLVPAIIEASCEDDALPYRIEYLIEINPATSIPEITRLDVYARPEGEAVHAAGLRNLSLASVVRETIRQAAEYLTKDDDLGGYVKTLPTKRPKARAVASAADRRGGGARRKNSPAVTDAESVRQTVEDLQRRGVRDWVEQACKAHGLSRPTLYRRLRQSHRSNPPKTKKRGKR